nr:MAG TPA: hypothetical protein [Caudoviricetes sp.]
MNSILKNLNHGAYFSFAQNRAGFSFCNYSINIDIHCQQLYKRNWRLYLKPNNRNRLTATRRTQT